MLTNLRRLICLGIGFSCYALVLSGQTKTIDGTLNSKVTSFEVNGESLSRCFQVLTSKNDFIVGFESVPQELQDQADGITLRVNNSTVRNLIYKLIEKDPRYTWTPTDVGISVFPLTSREDWMDTVVEEFKVDNVNREEAVNALLRLPE